MIKSFTCDDYPNLDNYILESKLNESEEILEAALVEKTEPDLKNDYVGNDVGIMKWNDTNVFATLVDTAYMQSKVSKKPGLILTFITHKRSDLGNKNHWHKVQLVIDGSEAHTIEELKHDLQYLPIYIDCDCKDYAYRYKYIATTHGYAFTPEHRPAVIRNPHDDLGPGCKHVASVISNQRNWVDKAKLKPKADE